MPKQMSDLGAHITRSHDFDTVCVTVVSGTIKEGRRHLMKTSHLLASVLDTLYQVDFHKLP